ncbi:MAG TPA: replicative DNA helicase [Myxococcales bacterium]|nr:replicative DNA helicase [Deltaproteobacteria bacterium]HAA56328.1 replicative DNA helicase [Myxococcales bacterium]|tara:strand:+ start:1879 stop:4506 length:2628 start_codon:yes stop_codon:yes gene_type:complete
MAKKFSKDKKKQELSLHDLQRHVPPHDLEAEKSVLGAVLLHNKAINELTTSIKGQDFYLDKHRFIFEAMKDLEIESEPIDVITLANKLKSRDQLDKVGQLPYLSELVDRIPTTANIAYYAQIIRSKSIIRRLITIASEIVIEAYSNVEDVGEFLDTAERKVMEIRQEREQKDLTPSHEIVKDTFKIIEGLYEKKELVTGIPTGFDDFDKMSSGLQPTDLIILAGRPSMGKAQPLDAHIKTPTGWTQMGDLELGQPLASHDGRPSVVTGIYPQGRRAVYTLTFEDGRQTEACAEHLWHVSHPSWDTHRILSTEEWMSLQEQQEGPFSIPLSSGDFGEESDLPLDPHVLGKLLTNPYTSLAFQLSDPQKQRDPAHSLSGADKRIPLDYLEASRPQRRALLSGLLEGGAQAHTTSPETYTFTTPHEPLALDTLQLVRSLGGIASLAPSSSQVQEWKITLRLPTTTHTLALKSIEYSRDTQTQCIKVSHPDALYITDQYIVTHNTSLALNMASNAAVLHEFPVAIFSLEMSKEQLMMRMLCSLARVNSGRLRTGQMKDNDIPKLTRAASDLARSKLYIDDGGNASVLEVRSKCRRLKMMHGKIGLIVIDYLQLMRGDKNEQSREQEISAISRGLKGLAKELHVPVLALSQLNRSLERRPDKRPVMSDLRECVVGDTLVQLADGRQQPIRDLVGTTPQVAAVTPDGKIIHTLSDKVWKVGKRPVFRLTLSTGRTLTATGKHRVLTDNGWKRIAELQEDDRIAIPRQQDSDELRKKAQSDLFWDEIRSIEDAGEEDVYDLTVPGPASWISDGVVSHNSGAIEQDADVIMFVYRDEVYNEDTEDKGLAELIIGKQRNGPIGTVRMRFFNDYTRFDNLYPEDH